MAYLKCADASNQNNFLIIENGKIGIYKDINGSAVLFKPLTQAHIQNVDITDATSLMESLGRYDNTPNIFVFPTNAKTYITGTMGINQLLSLGAPTVTKAENDKFIFSGLSQKVKSADMTASFCALPSSSFYQGKFSGIIEQTYGPWYIPGVISANIGLDISCPSGVTVTLSTGISGTRDGSIAWSSITKTAQSKDIFTINSQNTSSGNYLWAKVHAESGDQKRNCLFQLNGAVVSTNGNVLFSGGSQAVCEVGE